MLTEKIFYYNNIKWLAHNELKRKNKIQFQMWVWPVIAHDIIPQRLKSTFSEILSSLWVSFEDARLHSNCFQKTLILTFEACSALSYQNKTFFTRLLLAHCVAIVVPVWWHEYIFFDIDFIALNWTLEPKLCTIIF